MTAGQSYETADADAAALAAAGSLAEEALGLHCEALMLLEDGWSSQSGSAATQLLRQYRGEATELVAALRAAAEEFRALRDMAQCPADPADPGIDQAVSRLQERPAARFNTPDPAMYAAAPVPQQPPAWASPLPGPALATPALPSPALPSPALPSPALPSPALPSPALPSAALPSAALPSPALPNLPDLGGALAGLVAQIVDSVTPEPAGAGADVGSDGPSPPPGDSDPGDSDPGDSDPVVDANPETPEARKETPAAQAESSYPSGATSPRVVAPAQPVSPPAPPPPPVPPPTPAVDPPLVAAERPPPPVDPVPDSADSDTPVAVAVPENPDPSDPATGTPTPCEIAANELPQVGR